MWFFVLPGGEQGGGGVWGGGVSVSGMVEVGFQGGRKRLELEAGNP